jgi:hypothetical protein
MSGDKPQCGAHRGEDLPAQSIQGTGLSAGGTPFGVVQMPLQADTTELMDVVDPSERLG